MKQDKAEKIIKKAELKAKKAAQQVEAAGKKAEATRKKQEAQAQKKAARAAAAATKKAAAKTKKAETVAKKAQLAAQKAEEKKAKAMAKAAAKAVGPEKEGEGGEDGGKKKKGKKKLLLLAIPVVVVAVAAGVFFFLKGRGGEEEKALEPIAPPAEYVLDEAHITALPVWGDEVLVYQEEVPPEPAQEPEKDAEEDKKDASQDEAKDESKDESKEGGDAEGEEKAEEPKDAEEPGFTKILYRYEGLKDPVGLVSAYAAVMTAEDAGFSVVDETLLRVDPPEEYAARGSVQLARNLPKAEDGSGGGVQSLLLSWEAGKCSVVLDMPEGRVHDPKPETPTPSSPRRGLSDLESIHPSKLGLPGESMEAYRLIPQEGSFRIANSISTRVNVYGENNQFMGSYFLSADGKLYKLDEEANAVVELDWE